ESQSPNRRPRLSYPSTIRGLPLGYTRASDPDPLQASLATERRFEHWMNPRRLFSLGMLAAVAVGRVSAQGATSAALLMEQHSGTSARLQAVSAVNERVVWVSGLRATWARTLDGGETWAADSMQGPDSWLEFRDVHAVSADRAWLLAAGPGDSSRIYHTEDGGRHWALQFQNRDPLAFYDALDFWDARR